MLSLCICIQMGWLLSLCAVRKQSKESSPFIDFQNPKGFQIMSLPFKPEGLEATAYWQQRKRYLKALTQQFRIDLQSVFHLCLLFTAIRARKRFLHSCPANGLGGCRLWTVHTPARRAAWQGWCHGIERSKNVGKKPTLVKGEKNQEDHMLGNFCKSGPYSLW